MTRRSIVHIEIPTRNGRESVKFYEQLFGWQIVHDEGMNYTMWNPEEGPGGGFSTLSETVKPGDVLIYVDSQDIDADLKKAEALGGKIVQPKSEIPNTGWFGMFTDPTGNAIALYTSMNPAG
jgi:predicted enzyme related to lactoylglutathione lyase